MKSDISEDLRLKLDALPTEPGIYLMKRKDGQIIYIGKAKNLRSRVRSYFQKAAHDGRRQFKALVRNIADLDCIVTATEQEALILEATQIKAHKPRYNILLKDDKKYPFIRITNEAFPRIFATRTVVRDGSRYLGPYSNVHAKHTTLDIPDLLLIDGGKGQLSSALQALREVGAEQQPVLGLAKRLEEIFLPDQSAPILLPKTSASLRLLQVLRGKRTLTSALDNIPGVGPKRRNALLQLFGSVQRIKNASVEEISAVPGFSPKLAEEIQSHLQGNKPEQTNASSGPSEPSHA